MKRNWDNMFGKLVKLSEIDTARESTVGAESPVLETIETENPSEENTIGESSDIEPVYTEEIYYNTPAYRMWLTTKADEVYMNWRWEIGFRGDILYDIFRRQQFVC